MFCLGGLEKGGAERVVCKLANYLVKQGNEVALIINSDKNKAYELDSKIDIKLLDKKNKCNFLERNFLRIRNLKKFIINYKPDVILAFLQEPTARLLFLKTFDFKIRKIPVIVSVFNLSFINLAFIHISFIDLLLILLEISIDFLI